MFKYTKQYIEESTSNSTRFHFHDNEFYRNLTPSLKKKLVKRTLTYERTILDYFFEERNSSNFAP